MKLIRKFIIFTLFFCITLIPGLFFYSVYSFIVHEKPELSLSLINNALNISMLGLLFSILMMGIIILSVTILLSKPHNIKLFSFRVLPHIYIYTFITILITLIFSLLIMSSTKITPNNVIFFTRATVILITDNIFQLLAIVVILATGISEKIKNNYNYV